MPSRPSLPFRSEVRSLPPRHATLKGWQLVWLRDVSFGCKLETPQATGVQPRIILLDPFRKHIPHRILRSEFAAVWLLHSAQIGDALRKTIRMATL